VQIDRRTVCLRPIPRRWIRAGPGGSPLADRLLSRLAAGARSW